MKKGLISCSRNKEKAGLMMNDLDRIPFACGIGCFG